MFERVAVIGAGAAGVAACWSAGQRGAALRLFDSGVGASALAGGAVDDRPWEEVARAVEVLDQPALARPLPPSVLAFADALGLWRLPRPGEPLVRLATEAGRVRLARGCDKGLLDLAGLPRGARVLLPRAVRPEWDADALARALAADAWAEARALSFEAIDAKLWKLAGEEAIAAAELAARHDDAERLGWLEAHLRDALAEAGRADALLLGPWLGADRPRAPRLGERLGLPVGEILGGVGGAAGLRFEAARLELLSRVPVELDPVRAVRVTPGDARSSGSAPDGAEVRVELESGESVIVDAVVLALGGVAAGGIVYDPPERDAEQDVAPAARPAFRLSLDAPVTFQAFGRAFDMGSSIHGPALDELAWPSDADPGLLEAIGLGCGAGLQVAPQVFAAGDVVADRPRTLLQAVYSGICAGAAAAGEPGSLR